MTDPHGVISRISWRDLLPWLIIFRSFAIAVSPALLAIATAAVIITPVGWRIGGFVFLPREQRVAMQAMRADIPRTETSQLARNTPAALQMLVPDVPTALLEAYFDLAEPMKRFFQLEMTLRETAYYAFGTLWTLAIWAFVGGVVTRRAVVQLATETPLDIVQTIRYAARRYHWYVLAPLYPLVGVLLLTVPIAIVGLPARFAPGIGSVLAGVVWIFVALAGLAASWLFGGLLFGWPLMWPTISAERDGDPFEAFGRSYSYAYGKPLHLLFYALVAVVFGALGWAVVQVAMVLVREFGFWALSWGGGAENVADIRQQAIAFAEGVRVGELDNRWQTIGTSLIGLVVALIHSAATAFRYTYFFAAASAIYLLLRQDVDEKEMDEVYLEPQSPAETPSPADAASPGEASSPEVPPAPLPPEPSAPQPPPGDA